MTENNKALVSTLQGAVAITLAEGFPLHGWQRGCTLGVSVFFAMSAIRHLLLAYKDGSIVEAGTADYRHITTEDVRNCVEGECHCDERRIVSLEAEVERMRELLCVVPHAEAVPSVLPISEALPSAGESSTHKNSESEASSPAPSLGPTVADIAKSCVQTNAGATTGEGAQNEAETSVSTSNHPADNSNRGRGGTNSQPVAVVPSGGAPLPKSFHAAWGGPKGHGQVVKLEDALEYAASGGAPAMSAEQFLEEYEGELWIKDYLQKLQVRDFAEAYAASSNATLQLAHAGVMQQLRSADKWIDDLKSKVSTLEGELREARQEIEKLRSSQKGGAH